MDELGIEQMGSFVTLTFSRFVLRVYFSIQPPLLSLLRSSHQVVVHIVSKWKMYIVSPQSQFSEPMYRTPHLVRSVASL